jgi:hypothetical protein
MPQRFHCGIFDQYVACNDAGERFTGLASRLLEQHQLERPLHQQELQQHQLEQPWRQQVQQRHQLERPLHQQVQQRHRLPLRQLLVRLLSLLLRLQLVLQLALCRLPMTCRQPERSPVRLISC